MITTKRLKERQVTMIDSEVPPVAFAFPAAV